MEARETVLRDGDLRIERVPFAVKRALKAQAALQGTTMRSLLIDLVREAVGKAPSEGSTEGKG
jgi:hypothetical protein